MSGGALTAAAASGVLANDLRGAATLSAVLGATTSHGILSLHGDGSFIYTASAGYVGTDSFTYQATAAMQTSSAATVTLTVLPIPPTANDDSYSLQAGDTFSASPSAGGLANDANPGGQAIGPLATDTVYRNTDGTGGDDQLRLHRFADTAQAQSETAPTRQNGPAAVDVTTTVTE